MTVYHYFCATLKLLADAFNRFFAGYISDGSSVTIVQFWKHLSVKLYILWTFIRIQLCLVYILNYNTTIVKDVIFYGTIEIKKCQKYVQCTLNMSFKKLLNIVIYRIK